MSGRIESGSGGSTNIIVIFTPKVDRIYVHPAIVCPIVREGDDELDANLGCRINYLVEFGDVDGRGAVRKPLEDSIRRSCALATVLWQTLGIVCSILVIKCPCPKYFEASIFSGG